MNMKERDLKWHLRGEHLLLLPTAFWEGLNCTVHENKTEIMFIEMVLSWLWMKNLHIIDIRWENMCVVGFPDEANEVADSSASAVKLQSAWQSFPLGRRFSKRVGGQPCACRSNYLLTGFVGVFAIYPLENWPPTVWSQNPLWFGFTRHE